MSNYILEYDSDDADSRMSIQEKLQDPATIEEIGTGKGLPLWIFHLRSQHWFLRCFFMAILFVLSQTTPITAASGQFYETMVSYKDATQRYALYLPSLYANKTSLPVLFLMDPRGRALIPMELFKDVAERLGYIVMSSYNTLSDADSAGAVDDRALNSMIFDAELRFKANISRLYLVGFSGTAHYAWAKASFLDGNVAGIVGVGSGLPIVAPEVKATLGMQRPFAYFGVAGTADFNYDNARLLDQQLDTTRIAHRFKTFNSFHSWPPKALAEETIEWLQYQAMRLGLAERNLAWMDSMCSEYLLDAQGLEQQGLLADAMRRYREVAADCQNNPVSAEAKQQMEKLAQSKTVKRLQKNRDKLRERFYKYQKAVIKFEQDYHRSQKSIKQEKALKRLNIVSLKQEAADTLDWDRSNAARRMLAHAFAILGFYEPRDYMEKEDYAHAAGMLKLAQQIYPDLPRVCYWLAQAESQLRQTKAALEALDCAVKGKWGSRETIVQDEKLEPLHDNPIFWEIVNQAQQ